MKSLARTFISVSQELIINLFKSLLKTSTTIVMGLSVLTVSCGKKAKNDNGSPERTTPELEPTEMEQLINRQVVACESNQACPNYLTKIAIIRKKKLTFCTGFLVDDQTIATSTSCIPNILRRAGEDCSKDIFFFFPRTAYRAAERVGCKEVVQVSHQVGSDPILWRDDVSFLRMDKTMNYRRNARFDRDGLTNNKDYNVWFVDQLDETTALVRKDSCQALHGTYVNPLASNVSSPGMVFAGCPFNSSNSGAPVLDNRGRVRAMVSAPMSESLRKYLESTGLLINPLKPMLHATNFACAPTIFDSEVLDERECSKDLRYAKLDDLRSSMLSSVNLFSEMKQKLEDSIAETSKYVQFAVELNTNGDISKAKIYPKCFKPLKNWLQSLNRTRNNYVFEVSIPDQTFRRAMDENGRVQGIVQENPNKKYFVQFSLKSLRSQQKSVIFMWNDGENNTYQNVTEDCGSLF